MDLTSYWHLLFEYQMLPCFIAQKDNSEIIYYNESMERLFLQDVPIVGSKFYSVIEKDSATYMYWENINWDIKNHVRDKIFHRISNQVFSVDFLLIDYLGISYILGRFEAIQTTKRFHFSFEEMMSHCISISQGEESDKDYKLLEILGEFYNAEKTFIYHIDRNDLVIRSVESWCRVAGNEVNSVFDDVSECKKLLQWFQKRDEMGMIQAYKNQVFSCELSLESELLSVLDLQNIVLSVIENPDKEVYAFVGMSDWKNSAADFRLLQGVTRFIETELSKQEYLEQKVQCSQFDDLTGFLTRGMYLKKMELLEEKLPSSIGVIYANANGLKMINSEFGYAHGDEHLKKVCEILKNHFEQKFYRISGDEFITFVEGSSKGDFTNQVMKLQEFLRDHEEKSFTFGYSWAEGRFHLEHLIKEADALMYINKQEFYATSFQFGQDYSDEVLRDLFKYLRNDEFIIYLQPQVYLSDFSLYGAEALIRRWDSENQKMVFPVQFIPFYEKKSLIRHIDLYVVEKVCQLLSEWSETRKLIPISVNLSRVTLQEFGIVQTIAKICDQYAVPRKYLVIEVTERVGLVENNVASSLICEFKDEGFHISLDDFGCAYSNIVTLAQIEVDEVKIDKSLIDNLTSNEKNKILVKNVLNMCNELKNTSTLAEGIEVLEQGEQLREYGCQLGQGYYFSRPIPISEFISKYYGE